MTSEKAFQLYFALKLHFTSNYDVFERGTNFTGRNSVTIRKDFGLILPFTKIVKTERDMIELCVANHLYGNSDFLYDQSWAEENYKHWCKVKESLTYTFEKDLATLESSSDRFESLDGYLEKQVISDLLSSKIQYETLIMLDRRLPIIDKIEGFDSGKYKVRMHKASKFVNKGTLGLRHNSQIDIFLSNMKGSHHGNISIPTT